MALDTTLAGPASNSYRTRAEALVIIPMLVAMRALGLSSTAFLALSGETQDFLLAIGADQIDLSPFPGQRQSGLQRREWPRALTGRPWLNGVIPDQVGYAQVAQALWLSASMSQAESNAARGVQSWTVGDESQTLSQAALASGLGVPAVSPPALALLVAAGITSNAAASIHIGRA